MAERNMRIRLGAFVLLALFALTVLIVLFGGSPKFFTNRTKYSVYFTEAPGVTTGTPVRKSGVRIGQVIALDIDETTGTVKLTVEIDGKHLPRQSEEPVIARGLLSGDTTVDFIPKVDKEGLNMTRSEAYPSGAEIMGVPPLNTNRLLNTAQETVPNAQQALQTFTSTVGAFRQVGPKAERTLDEISEFMKTAKAMLPELRETNKRVQEFIGETSPATPTPNPMPTPTPMFDPNRNKIGLLQAPPVADQGQAANLKTLAKEATEFIRVLKPLAEDLRGLVKDNQGELTKILRNIRVLSERASDLLSDDNRTALVKMLKQLQDAADEVLSKENREAITTILKNLKDGSSEVGQAIRKAGGLVERADAAMKDLGEALKTGNVAVKNFNDRITQVKTILDHVERLSKPLADTAEPTVKNIARAADELANTIIESRKLIALLTRENGTLGKFVNDPALYNQLVDSTVNLNRTLIRAEKIAKDLEIFADKVARKPESIGIGGAIRPSLGLKESPYAPSPTTTPYPTPYPGSGNAGGLRPIAPAIRGPVELYPSVPLEAQPLPAPIEPRSSTGPLAPIPPIRNEVK